MVEADLDAALTAKASWTDVGGFANTLASTPTAAVTALPTVTVAAATGGETVTEGTDAAFTLSRTGSTAAALTVTVTVSETGSVLKDASAVPSSVTFDVGSDEATLALATNDDDTDDDNGTVTVTLGTGTGYTVGDPGAAMVAVSDNDVPVDFVLAVPATVAEDAGTVTVTVTATPAENAPPATLVEVQLARVSGTATGGSDYDAVSETVRFQVSDFAPATVDGQPRYQAEWTHAVVIHDDEVVEDGRDGGAGDEPHLGVSADPHAARRHRCGAEDADDRRQRRGERGAVVHLFRDVRRGGERHGGGHGGGGGRRRGRRHHGLRDQRRRGCGLLLDRADDRGADVRRCAELRGRAGPGAPATPTR